MLVIYRNTIYHYCIRPEDSLVSQTLPLYKRMRERDALIKYNGEESENQTSLRISFHVIVEGVRDME